MEDFKNLAEVQTDSQEIYDGVILHVFKDTVSLPNGNPATREVIRHVGAVGVIPVTDDGKVIIERQFRYPLNEVITEIPAGKLDSKTEDRLEAAKRELKEETGLENLPLSYRGIVTFVSNEYGTEYMHLFTSNEYDGEINYDCDEGKLEWVKKEKINSLPIWEGDKIFLALLDQNVPFFSLKLCYKGDSLVSHTLEYAKNA